MVSAGYGMDRLTGARDWARPYRGRALLPLVESYWRIPAAARVESDVVDFARWMQAMLGDRPEVLPNAVLQIAHHSRATPARPYGGPPRPAPRPAAPHPTRPPPRHRAPPPAHTPPPPPPP